MNPEHNYPIGRLLIRSRNGSLHACTASVINTSNENIGVTAAHCLVDNDRKTLDINSMSFSPGYNDGNEGPLGTVDPEGEGLNLQDYTGGLGWRFDIGNNTPTNVFGYPNSGDLMNCLKNSKQLCEWQGNTQQELENSIAINYIITGFDLGEGTIGGPFIFQYDRNTNLGYVYSVYKAYRNTYNESVASAFDVQTFCGLLLRLS
ncbi:31224_t:CDS:2 [Gigaspora margarita]|uniref:31224_t:CDS:1 n=1 Tax=Gigaspora margarita TaxID=4874 RepID=A0ABN7VFT1_GIGMA|nr:31224_t:CDS:2 [Gigaspora margarita]